MKQDNNTTREKSIEWWSNLHYEKAHQLRTQYFPGAMLISHTDIEHIYLSEHPEQPAKEQSSNREEKLKTELECMYSLNREGWNKVEFYEKENTRLKERIEVLERAFYMDICRAYNAGKQNAFEMVAEGKRNGESLEAFKSSHEYFIGEFPTFKTNVP